MFESLAESVLAGKTLTSVECLAIASCDDSQLPELFRASSRIRDRFRGLSVDLCAIVNAKSGGCPEDCAWCAQSGRSGAATDSYPLLSKDAVCDKAREAKDNGARRFCVVTSGRRASERDINDICAMITEIRAIGLLPCATLGLLSRDDLIRLKDAGLERYHNNLETSERFFGHVCSTHSYQEKVHTIQEALSLGLSVCSGGIFGIGESWEDRIEMAFSLHSLGVDSVPINFLTPIVGTRLAQRQPLSPFEALRIISLYRFILPDRQIRVCGGRMQTLGGVASMVFRAGADGLLVGNYLTTLGRDYEDDLRVIRRLGFSIA